MALVRIDALHKHFGSNHVLRGIDLDIEEGQVIALIGRSGSGKSTLLRTINGLESFDEGCIEVDGERIHPHETDLRALRQKVGMVFQQFNLFPHLTVLQNVIEAPLTVKGLSRDAIVPRAEELLRKVGLIAKCGAYPSQLSGGQKQRVAIARALAMEPDIMLFDEPTSALDPEMINEVLDVMTELAQEGMTMMCVTHEMGFAKRVANRVIFMDHGRIVEDDSKDAFFANPRSERAQQFLAKILHH